MDGPSSIIDLKDYKAIYKFKITAIKGPAPVWDDPNSPDIVIAA